MKRGKPLGSDPDKVRAWQRRSAEKAAANRGRKASEEAARGLSGASTLSRKGKGGANPPRPEDARMEPEGPLSPGEWREMVWWLDGGRCVNCRKLVPLDGDRWTWQAHHPIEKQNLRPSLKWDPRNGVVTCRRCHERHTTATARIPAERLPGRCREFAIEIGPSAVVVLDRAHPPGGGVQPRNEGRP